jgi:hypothetical protein
VAPLKLLPETTTSCVPDAESNRELIEVTVGTEDVMVNAQTPGAHVASSDAFKNVTKVAFALFSLTFLPDKSASLQVIFVAAVVTTKQSIGGRPPRKAS